MFVIDDIIWLNSIVDKLICKHNVTTTEVEEVLEGNCKFLKKQSGKVDNEHLYNALGRTSSGRYLSIFFIRKLNKNALIVSARDMNIKERNIYGKK